jgi:hypothetical protein
MPDYTGALIPAMSWRFLDRLDLERRDRLGELLPSPDIAMRLVFVAVDRPLFGRRRRMKRHDESDRPDRGRAPDDVDRLVALQVFQDVAENENVSWVMAEFDPPEIDVPDDVVSIAEFEPRDVRRMDLDRDPGEQGSDRECRRMMAPEAGAGAQVDNAADPAVRALGDFRELAVPGDRVNLGMMAPRPRWRLIDLP